MTGVQTCALPISSKVGEVEALRMHAAELLLLLGTAIVMLVEKPEKPVIVEAPAADATAPTGELSLQQS